MKRTPILMYHNVDSAINESLSSLYVTPHEFARQLNALHALGFWCVSLVNALPFIRENRRERIAVITFDDGYKDTLENALPILIQYGFSATCFVVSGLIGKTNSWDGQLTASRPLMNAENIRQWHSAGMEIGAHSRTHRNLQTLDDVSVKEEVEGSKSDLEEILQTEVSSFAYPFGQYDDKCRSAVISAGYTAAVTASVRRSCRHYDMFALPRIGVVNRSSLLFRILLTNIMPDPIFRRLFPKI